MNMFFSLLFRYYFFKKLVFLCNKCILLTCQIFLRVFPCTIIFLKANIFLFSASQNSCSFWIAILFFATRRIWADIWRVIQPIRSQNSSYTVNDYIINIYTAISIKVVHEQSGKVEYERERLLGISSSLSRSHSTFPLCSWTTLIEIAVYIQSTPISGLLS
jgi:hypothetical protein